MRRAQPRGSPSHRRLSRLHHPVPVPLSLHHSHHVSNCTSTQHLDIAANRPQINYSARRIISHRESLPLIRKNYREPSTLRIVSGSAFETASAVTGPPRLE